MFSALLGSFFLFFCFSVFPLDFPSAPNLGYLPLYSIQLLSPEGTEANIAHHQIQVFWKFPLPGSEATPSLSSDSLAWPLWLYHTFSLFLPSGNSLFCQWLFFRCYWEDKVIKCDSLSYMCCSALHFPLCSCNSSFADSLTGGGGNLFSVRAWHPTSWKFAGGREVVHSVYLLFIIIKFLILMVHTGLRW